MTDDHDAVLARFWSKVDKSGSCWLWTASQNGNGYGAFRLNYKKIYAHRFAYQILVGPIPEGLQLDHLCKVRNCVNPAHLEAVTQRENLLRGEGLAAVSASKTHCPYGHPYAGENLYTRPNGHRECRTCMRERDRLRYAQKKKYGKYYS